MKKIEILLAIISILIIVSCNNHSQKQEKKEIVICSYGGSFQDAQREAFFKPFEKETGIKIIEANWSGEYAKIKSMVDAKNVVWDIVSVAENSNILRGINDHILEKIDFKNIDTSKYYSGAFSAYSVGFDFFSTALAYNAELFQGNKTPNNWEDFWDIKSFPGKRCLRKDPRTTLEFALIADGVNKNSLYPLDIERAFKSLEKIKPYVKVWWTSGHQPAQLLVDKEVSMASAFNGRIWNAVKNDKKPLKVVWNGGCLDVDSWVILKGTKNYDSAMEFIKFTSRPEVQANFAKLINYGPTIKRAYDLLPKDIKDNLPTSPANYKKQFLFGAKWWAKNEKMVEEKWNEWLIK